MKETAKTSPSNTRQSEKGSAGRGHFFSSGERSAFFATPVVQPKLSVGKKGDPYEQEADAAADKVVSRSPAPSISPSANPTKLSKKEEPNGELEHDLQRKPFFESDGDGSLPVRRKEGDKEDEGGGSGLETELQASKGQGRPMDDKTRGEMESGFGRDFSGVSIHTGPDASRMSNDLNAQAFTHGSDIYFANGKYDPDSSSGKHLLAHELTHTVQQREGLSRQMVQRAENQECKKETTGKKSWIDFDKKEIVLEVLYLPTLKRRNQGLIGSKATRKKGYKRKDSYVDSADSSKKAQAEVWKSGVEKTVGDKVKALTEKAASRRAYDSATDSYYLSWESLKLIGSQKTITDNSLVPLWNRQAKASAYDVDHVKELQLGGYNSIDNMELLNFSANRASGSAVKNSIEKSLHEFLISPDAAKQATACGKTLPGTKTAKSNYDITFNTIAYNDSKINFSKAAMGRDYWSKKDIGVDAKHLRYFVPMTATQIAKAKGVANDPVVYTSEAGGTGLRQKDFARLPGVKVKAFDFPATATGDIVGNVKLGITPPSIVNSEIDVPIQVRKMNGVVFGGYMPRRGGKGKGGLEKMLSKLEIIGLSPADVDMVDLVPAKGLVVQGRIHPTLDLVKGTDLDFFIEGKDFGISKTISSGEIKLPSPFKINDAFLTIGAGTRGIFVQGDVLFEIKKLGKGKISGLGKSNGDFGIKGNFEFDPKLFKNGSASIEISYNNKDGWGGGGELQFGAGVVKGIKSGKISVKYANKELTASGSAEVNLKGVEEVTLGIRFAEEASEIEGGIKIAKLPGLKSGEGKLKVVKKGEDYDFSGSGTITPDIVGISTQVGFEFQNDLFMVDASVEYNHGRLKGKLNVGVTNRAIGAEGKPTGDALPDMKVFGGGSLELKLTDKLSVSAGVKLLENGEVEVKGGIKLPEGLEVVPKLYSIQNKPIVKIPPIHIPIFGIPLGVTTIGIEAVITPRLDASVQIGPGTLTNVGAQVTYNPAHPEELSVTGSADFEFIAEAGISAGVDFGLSASIAVASLTGGINLSAFIKAAAKQPVFHTDIKYSPKTGFELNGLVNAKVAAILGFSGDLFVKASAGVWPLEISKTWRWPLFKKEIDTGLEIGFEFPFSYKNNKADVSFDNLKFTYPSLDDITTKVKKQIVEPLKNKF